MTLNWIGVFRATAVSTAVTDASGNLSNTIRARTLSPLSRDEGQAETSRDEGHEQRRGSGLAIKHWRPSLCGVGSQDLSFSPFGGTLPRVAYLAGQPPQLSSPLLPSVTVRPDRSGFPPPCMRGVGRGFWTNTPPRRTVLVSPPCTPGAECVSCDPTCRRNAVRRCSVARPSAARLRSAKRTLSCAYRRAGTTERATAPRTPASCQGAHACPTRRTWRTSPPSQRTPSPRA